MSDNRKAEAKIYDSFIALIRSEGFESISIKQILLDSGVSRSTFYRLFEDKYDLLNKTLLYVTKKYVDPEKYAENEWREFFVDLLTRLKQSRTLKMFYHHSSFAQFFTTNQQFFTELLRSRIEKYEKNYDESLNLEIMMIASCCSSVLYYWMKNDFTIPVNEVIDRGYEVVPDRLKDLLRV
ncbi:MAG: TetR/AcrR family transcriptional regulator [Oscillospiraceae bacterium]|nr:TetR/AcrR family transcriptional regulator [Oscillospiraceae bacterium]